MYALIGHPYDVKAKLGSRDTDPGPAPRLVEGSDSALTVPLPVVSDKGPSDCSCAAVEGSVAVSEPPPEGP